MVGKPPKKNNNQLPHVFSKHCVERLVDQPPKAAEEMAFFSPTEWAQF
jgi:hypothetical protein